MRTSSSESAGVILARLLACPSACAREESPTPGQAEVIVPGTDEELLASLHGVLARDANYDAVAARIGGDNGYAGIVDTLRAIGAQHPDAMWLVHAWWVDSVVE
jgi:hypothetical protein